MLCPGHRGSGCIGTDSKLSLAKSPLGLSFFRELGELVAIPKRPDPFVQCSIHDLWHQCDRQAFNSKFPEK
jgi:hypothetical protein